VSRGPIHVHLFRVLLLGVVVGVGLAVVRLVDWAGLYAAVDATVRAAFDDLLDAW
jgi:hypothetical protein